MSSSPPIDSDEIAKAMASIVRQITEALANVEPISLAELTRFSPATGVYEIHLASPDPAGLYIPALKLAEPLYVGVACTSLVERMGHHLRTISLVNGIGPEHLGVRTLTIDPGAALAAEWHLIDQYRPVWNDGGALPGFGSRPPGRGRPGVLASWFHSVHTGHPAFDTIPLRRDPNECRQRIANHFASRATQQSTNHKGH